MKLIVDSNILFTYFWKQSTARQLFLSQKLKLYSPEFALKEIDKYSSEILKKTGLSKQEFNKCRQELLELVSFVQLKKYTSFLSSASKLLSDKDDIDFMALALRLECPVWSNDTGFKEQKRLAVLNTKELIILLG